MDNDDIPKLREKYLEAKRRVEHYRSQWLMRPMPMTTLSDKLNMAKRRAEAARLALGKAELREWEMERERERQRNEAGED